MIGTRLRQNRVTTAYRQPTLDELLHLCIDFDLISNVRTGHGRLKIRCKDEFFDVTEREAEILTRGLLLGFFALQTRDDLGLSDWSD